MEYRLAMTADLMIYNLLKTLHLLSIIVWVGGMVFAHFFLRPALAALSPPQRLPVMRAVLQRFFAAVLVASVTALVTGLWMIGRVAKQVVQSGGQFHMPFHWWAMAVGGILMVALFGHIRFVLFRRFDRAVTAAEQAPAADGKGSTWNAAAGALASIRQWVTVNLALGLLIVVVVVLHN